MSKPSDLLILALVVAAVIWLNVPRFLLPALFLTLIALSVYRWRRDGSQPMAAERYRARLIASCILLAALSIPLIVKAVPPNGLYGFRNSLTRSSPEIWYAANAFMGWALLVAAAVSTGGLALVPTARRWLLLATFLLPLLCAAVASFLYLQRFA